ncbi:hypothetical protein DRJ25_00225 [Candidatus Woesearchaeota archaeon]|nr:MAG: hypothetical protein DRJ25_00225 [Candidatus Woesearchaeota archaeon]
MLARTHAAIGFLTALFLFPFFRIKWFLFFPAVVFGSILPDIDHEGSKVNQLLPLTKYFSKLFKHRGFFHSIFPVLFFVFLELSFKLDGIGIALALGYLSHLLSDGLTPTGVNLLHPAAKLRIEGFIPTGGIVEAAVFVFVIVADIVKLFLLVL